MSGPYPCGPWRVEGACVKSLSHGIWSKVVTCDNPKFNDDGKRGTAERIAACFNACEGMNDPPLEISALRSRSDSVPAMCAEVETLRAEVRRLRELAKHVIAMQTDAYLSGHPEWQEICAEARAALGGNHDAGS